MRWFSITAVVAACANTDPLAISSYGTEVDGCEACQAILVECTSTAQNETQFAECRDLWLDCQTGRAVGPCRNPRDDDACELCRERLVGCKSGGDSTRCEAEFDTCKLYLIRASDHAEQCTEEAPVEALCTVCAKDHVRCVSDSSGDNSATMCADKFGDCLDANGLDAQQCALPTGFAACDLCDAVRAGCVAAGGDDCDGDFDACIAALTDNVVCDVNAGDDAPTTDTCAHDVCAYGDALESGCNACVADVCALDSYCCNTTSGQWDDFCLALAASLTSCGCDPPSPVCTHSVCEYGAPLTNGCSACVTQICAQDPYCCNTKWDNLCVSVAFESPTCGCFI